MSKFRLLVLVGIIIFSIKSSSLSQDRRLKEQILPRTNQFFSQKNIDFISFLIIIPISDCFCNCCRVLRE